MRWLRQPSSSLQLMRKSAVSETETGLNHGTNKHIVAMNRTIVVTATGETIETIGIILEITSLIITEEKMINVLKFSNEETVLVSTCNLNMDLSTS